MSSKFLQERPTPPPRTARVALLVGGLAALLASSCCLGPLVLMALGISGAWIGNLAMLEPYRPIFIAAASGALFLAWRRIWRGLGECPPGTVCAVPQVNRAYRLFFSLVAAMVLLALAFPYLAPLFY